MEVADVRVVWWVLLGGVVVLTGAALGFLASLLRPRRYADFAGSRDPLGTV
jgi:hypothetical protein